MTLQDEEAVGQAEADAEAPSAQATEAEGTKAPRVKVEYDDAAGTVTLTQSDGTSNTYSLDGIPAGGQRRLSLIGLSRAVQSSKDPAAALERMRAGEMPGRVPAAPKSKPLDDWRKAYAAAKVKATKKSDAPLTIEQANELARALTREQLVELKTHPAVVTEFAKLKGAAAELI